MKGFKMNKYIQENLKNFIVVTGHYGCGKTNFAMNLAMDYAAEGKEVTLVDMDLINPYFRTSDYKGILEEKGIEVITPVFGATNLDIPSLPAKMYSIFEKKNIVIIDVGGDDAGSMVLGRFRPQFDTVDYDMLYVVNRFRNMSMDTAETIEVLMEIESVSGLKPSKLVNNSHLMYDTNEEVFKEGRLFAQHISEQTGLPLLCSTVRKDLYSPEAESFIGRDDIYPIEIYVTTVWQNQNRHKFQI